MIRRKCGWLIYYASGQGSLMPKIELCEWQKELELKAFGPTVRHTEHRSTWTAIRHNHGRFTQSPVSWRMAKGW